MGVRYKSVLELFHRSLFLHKSTTCIGLISFAFLAFNTLVSSAIIPTVSAADYSLTIDIASQIELKVIPDSMEGTFVTSDTTIPNISIKTNNYSGYTLGISASTSNSNALKNTNDNTITIPSITAPVSSTNYADSTYAASNNLNNTWGYRPSKLNSTTNTNYLQAPTSTSAVILDQTTSANTTSNTYNIAIGSRINLDQAPGTYANTFVITAIANAVPYSITYNANAGSDTVTNLPAVQSSTTMDNKVSLSANIPTRANYGFAGWCNNNASETSCSDTLYQASSEYPIDQTGSNNITLYAIWTPNTYTITLDNQSTTTAGTTAIYEKYNTGIYLDSGLTKQMTTSANPITKPAKTYTITYDANSQGATYDTTDKTSSSATFNGYYDGSTQMLNASGNITSNFTTTKYSAAKTLTASWTNNSITLPTITKTGYTCKWAEGSASGTQYAGDTSRTISADTTYVAKCTANTYTINYYIGNGTTTAGATKLGSSTCTYGSSCILTKYSNLTPAYSYSNTTFPCSTGDSACAWSFAGWSTSTSGTTRDYTDNASITYNTASDTNLYAVGQKTFRFYSGINANTSTNRDQYWNPYTSTTLTAITIPSQTNIDGWSFLGYIAASNSASSSVTYAASKVNTSVTPKYNDYTYNRSVYSRTATITYDANGGTGTTNSTTATQYYNSGYQGTGYISSPSITLASNGFTKTGHTFNKWAAGSAGGTQYAAGSAYTFNNAVTDSASVTMYATWTANTYTITLDNKSATTAGTTTIYETYGSKYSLTSGGAAITAITKPARKYTYTITYDMNGTGITAPTSPASATRTDTFNGYYTAATGGTQLINNAGTITAANTYFTSNSTIHAQWTNGSATATLPTITKTGHTCHWNTKSDDSGTSYTSGQTGVTLTANITLYAACTPNTYTVTYKSYDGNTTYGIQSFTYGTAQNLRSYDATSGWTTTPSAPSGKSFYGWATSANSTTRAYTNGQSVNNLTATNGGNVTVYAIWQKDAVTYTATTQKNVSSATGSNTSVSCTIPEVYNGTTQATSCDITLPANPYTLSGWTFNGWVNAGSSTTTTTTSGTAASGSMSISGNVNIVATWKKTLTANFYQTDNTNDSKSVTIYNGATSGNVTAPAVDTAPSGKTIVGWGTSATATSSSVASSGTATISSNTSYYAIYKYTVTASYNGNGNTGGSTSATTSTAYITSKGSSGGTNTTSASVTLATNGFTRTGYTFSKWSTASTGGTQYDAGAKVPLSSDQTFYAIWSINSYTATINVNPSGYGSVSPTSVAKNYSSSITTSDNTITIGGTTVTATPATATAQYTYAFDSWTNNCGSSLTENCTITANFTRTVNKYYLDLNGYLDEVSGTNISGYGTADVYINGALKSSGVSDFYQQFDYGTTYEIKNIQATTGHTYNGVYSGSLSGTITGTTVAKLNFTTNTYTVTFKSYDGNTTYGTQSFTYGTAQNLRSYDATSGWTTTPSAPSGKSFYGWATSANSTTRAYTNGQSVNNLTATNGGNITLYAIWQKASVTYTATTKKNVSSATGTDTSVSCTINAVYNGTTQATSCNVTLPANPYTLSGWTFNGWVNAGSSTTTTTTSGTAASGSMSISGNVNIVATWKRTFTANFYQTDNTNDSKSVTIYNGATSGNITAPAVDTAPSGKTIVGWGTSATATSSSVASSGTATISSNTSYYAIYKYTVTASYDANGGTGTTNSTTGTAYITSKGSSGGTNTTSASVTLATNNFTKTGYAFSKWAAGSTDGAQSDAGATVLLAGNQTYYAIWTANTYTITLDNKSATTAGTTAIYETYGSKYSLTAGGTAMSTSANPITKPARTYTYTITYNANSQSASYTASPTSATRTDTFNGYYTAASGGTQYIGANGYLTSSASNTNFTSNGTLHAQWTNGSATATLPTITKTGHTCKWAEGSATSTQYAGGTSRTISANTTYYAVCTVNSYTLTLNPNGGTYNGTTSNTTITQNYNTTTNVLNSPTRAGYVFGGWKLTSGDGTIAYYTDSDILQKYYINSTSATKPSVYNNKSNGTVTHTVISDSTSSTGYSMKIVTNGEASPGAGGFVNYTNSASGALFYHKIVAKVPTGYQLNIASNSRGVGSSQYWLTSQAGTGDWATYIYVTSSGYNGSFSSFGHVYATGTSNTSVTWYLQESTMYRVGSSITTTQASDLQFTYKASNATLTAQWGASGAKVTWNANNGTIKSGTSTSKDFQYTTTYSATKTAPYYISDSDYTISRTGYTFAGWYTDASGGTQVFNASGQLNASVSGYSNASRVWQYYSGNVTLYAHWTANTYTITLDNKSATTAGTTAIYETYGSKYSLTSGGTATTTITKPARTYTYTISYNMNGTSITAPTSPASATRTDTFNGYYTAATGGTQLINNAGTITAANTYFTSNSTIHAQWTNGSATFNLPALSKSGYTCKWAEGSVSGTQHSASDSVTISANTTFVAVCIDTVSPNVTSLTSTTAHKSTSQTVTGKCTDEVGVTGYYFGTSTPTASSTFTAVSSTTSYTNSSLTANSASTYYFACKDAAGNISGVSQSQTTTANNYKSISFVNYKVAHELQTLTGTSGTYTTSNYTASGSILPSSTTSYLFPSGGTLTLNNLFTTPTGANSTRKGWGTTAPSTSTQTLKTDATATVTSGATYYGWYDRNTYTITIGVNNSSYGSVDHTSITARYGATLTTNSNKLSVNGTATNSPTTATATAATGYTTSFSSWSTSDCGSTITKNCSVTANFTRGANTYAITLDGQSATTAGTSTIYEKYNDGYYTDSAASANKMTTSANAVTIPQKKFTITYNANSQGATYDTTNKTSSSATFGGYYTSTGGAGDQYISSTGYLTSAASATKFSAAGTLYAKWTNNTITLPTITKTGYTCKWASGSASGTQSDSGASVTISANITYYAVCTANIYTITLNNQSATSAGTTTIYETYGSKYSLTSGGAAMSTSANPITKPTRNYTYTITYNANSQGATYTASPTSATRTDTFKGYYTTASSGTQYIGSNGYLTSSASNTNFTANGTLYAQWTSGSATFTLPTITKSGYTCKWAEGSTTGTQYAGGTARTIAANTGYYAVCTINATTFAQAYAAAGKSTYNGYYQMHEMTASICSAVTREQTAQLIDRRDGKIYWVAKLADDNCWMTQNLDFNINASTAPYLTSTYTDLNSKSSWAPSSTYYTKTSPSAISSETDYYSWDFGDYYWNPSGNTSWTMCPSNSVGFSNCASYGFTTTKPTQDGAGNSIDGIHYSVGTYYEWNAATAGSGGWNIDVDASDSICPKGWRLPTSGADNYTFDKLLNAYGYSSWSDKKTIQNTPLYLTPGGYYNGYPSNNFAGLGSSGYYWSAKAYTSESYAHQLSISQYGYANTYNTRHLGAPVRCVVAPAPTTYTLTLYANGGTFSNGSVTNKLVYTMPTTVNYPAQTITASSTNSASSSGTKKTSINDSMQYASNADYYQDITLNTGVAGPYTLTIYYATETNYDYICVFDGTSWTPSASDNCYNYSIAPSSNTGTTKDTYKITGPGSNYTSYGAVATFTLTSKTARIYFHSDGSVQSYGFWATFVSNSGTGPGGQTKLSGTYSTPTRGGYTFDSWFIWDNNEGTYRTYDWTYNSNNVITENTAVFARWTPRYMHNVDTWGSSLSIGQSIQAVDIRDSKVYWVTRLADGNIWMTQNLDFNINASTSSWLNPSFTDVSSTWTPSSTYYTKTSMSSSNSNTDYYSWDFGDLYYNPSGNSNWNPCSNTIGYGGCQNYGFSYSKPTVDSKGNAISSDEAEHYKVGTLYQWPTVTAQTNSTQIGIQTSSGIMNITIAEGSICPKGWRLPMQTSEYSNAMSMYGISSSSYNKLSMTSSPLYLVPGGFVSSGNLYNAGQAGEYWTSSIAASELWFGNSSFSVSLSTSKYSGLSVRCIARAGKSISEISTMQEFGNLSSTDKESVIKSMTTGTAYTLYDTRDNEVYKIAKLADGKVWMLDNLRLGNTYSISLDSSNTNIIFNFTLPASNLQSFYDNAWATPNSYNTAAVSSAYKNTITTNYGSGSGKIGNYYNYCAASAGLMCQNADATIAIDELSYDICPKGWHIPSYSSDFMNLYSTYGYNAASFRSAFSSTLGGYIWNIGNSTYNGIGSEGHFWSSSVYNNTYSTGTPYQLYDDSSSVNVTNSSRAYGFTIRCVAK